MLVSILLYTISFFSKIFAENYPEPPLSITDSIEKHGYRVETHEVTTEDGYILKIFRIPCGKKSSSINKKPTLLLHGLFGQAENYIDGAVYNASLAFFLADNGYDVWLGNTRGNKYGKKHKYLSPQKPKFWNFCWHEIGVYDIPAMVDHILKESSKEKLHYIGHSQGGTVFYVLNSMKPEYQNKFVHASLLAPSGYMNNFNNSLIISIAKAHKRLTKIAEHGKLFELPPPWFNLTTLILGTCDGIAYRSICYNIYDFLVGDTSQLVKNMVLNYAAHHLPSASTRQPLHYAQIIESGHFRPWDYGLDRNKILYGSDIPPNYPIENINVPITIFYGLSDKSVFPKDIENICKTLPNCSLFLMSNSKWNHLDFIFAIDATLVLYEPLLKQMDKFE